jgi:hypothetical protein
LPGKSISVPPSSLASLFPTFSSQTFSETLLYHHHLASDPTSFLQELAAVAFLQVSIEETREHPIEGGIAERKRPRLPADQGGRGKSPPDDPEHAGALVKAHNVALQVAGEVAGPAGNIERSPRRE